MGQPTPPLRAPGWAKGRAWPADALCGHPSLLTGAAGARQGQSFRRGAERPETASCEVEVPEHVAEVHSEELRAGRSIFIVCPLSGGGNVIATETHSAPPQDSLTL